MGLNILSEELLLKVKTKKSTAQTKQKLQDYPFDQLTSELNTDVLKKSFWINIYNSFYLILRRELQMEKPGIYRNRAIVIANKSWSLDDVEHGILRKFRYKYSLGYLSDPFVSSTLKRVAVDRVDYRIHFALNCGAKSCPPIAFYTPLKLEEQLDMSTQSFLENEIEFLKEKKEVWISSLFKWYLADFGGAKGIRKIIKEQKYIDPAPYKIRFKPYLWDESLNNFTESSFPNQH